MARVEAFTLGELLNKETAVVHIEKANPLVQGLYAAINQEFCRHSWSQVPFINREQDLGLPGLRLAKCPTTPIIWWRNSASTNPNSTLTSRSTNPA